MSFLRLVRAALREIFEESAYERFCAREGVRINRESYADFLTETSRAKQPKVKCC
jgi:hypothetical protein